MTIQRVPPRCDAVNPITGYKRIVHGFGKLMAQRRHILKLWPKQSWADPTGKRQNVSSFAKTILRVSWLKVVGVEAEHAAKTRVTVCIQVGVRKEECSDAPGRDLPRVFRSAHGSAPVGCA